MVKREHIYRAVRHPHMGVFIKLGYFIRGFLYGITGLVALGVAIGISKETISTADALYVLNNLFFGKIILVIVLAGLAGYSLWGVLRATLDFLDKRREKIKLHERLGYLVSSVSYAALAVPALLLIFDIGENRGYPLINMFLNNILNFPLGGLITILTGLIVITAGFFQIKAAFNAKLPADFRSIEIKKKYNKPFMLFAKTGITARGVIFILAGYFIAISGYSHNSELLKGVDNVLNLFLNNPASFFIFAIFGAGLTFFGIYSILLSIWVDLP
jgi:hypothetical protein